MAQHFVSRGVMMDLHIDLGQVVMAVILTIIGMLGWSIRSQVASFSTRLEKHEGIIITLVGDVQRLIGINIGSAQIAAERHTRQEARNARDDIRRGETP